MIVVIAAVAVVGVMLLALLSTTANSSKWTDREVAEFKAETAAETEVAAGDLLHGLTGQAKEGGGAAPMENLDLSSLGSGTEAQMDGMLPEAFSSPFSDDGGLDPSTGLPTPEYGGNRKVDDNEFDTTVAGLAGTISGGDISVVQPGWKERVRSDNKLND